MSNGYSLRALGFCGADDSVDVNLLGIICSHYPFVEFGVLFRPDKEGQPRYASREWVVKLSKLREKLSSSKDPIDMKLAAHLCGSRVDDFLMGSESCQKFLGELTKWGFGRVQINATKVNNVNTSLLLDEKMFERVEKIIKQNPKIEFIIQRNDETKKLWEPLLQSELSSQNISFLQDESKGTGVSPSNGFSWDKKEGSTKIGFAGGIGPKNIASVLDSLSESINKLSVDGGGNEPDKKKLKQEDVSIWIDMESSLRTITKDELDFFDIQKCYDCIHVVCEKGFFAHPDFLLQE